MGNPDHMAIARRGVSTWNKWRAANLKVQPDLTRIDLSGRDLRGIDLRGVGLFKANLSRCDLRGAILRQSILIKTDLSKANISGAHVYGASVWDVKLDGAIQYDLVVTDPFDDSVTTVDNLEVAQFIHLIMTNRKLRDVIDAITSKVVLILGRFTRERKQVLDHIKRTARSHNLLPILFDFVGPTSRNIRETVNLLAHLAQFIVVDLTSPRSAPAELEKIIPQLAVPVAPIIKKGRKPYGMFRDLKDYPWVLEPVEYSSVKDLSVRVFPMILRDSREIRLSIIKRREQ